MPRKIDSAEAIRMASLRLTRSGGRPAKPTKCPKCGEEQRSYAAARGHCVGKASTAAGGHQAATQPAQ